jgi:hypothetical protein
VINQPAHDPCVWNHVRNERPILFGEYKKRKEIYTFILLFIVREIEDIDEKKNKEPVDI